MTRKLSINGKSIIPDFDGIRDFVLNDEFIVPLEGTEDMLKLVETRLTEIIRVMTECLEVATNEGGLDKLVLTLFKAFAKSLHPNNMFAVLHWKAHLLEILLKLPTIEFKFFATPTTPNV